MSLRKKAGIAAVCLVVSAGVLFGQTQTSSQPTTIIGASGPVKAGQSITVHVELDSAPNIPRGYVNVGVQGVEPDNQNGAAGESVAASPDKKSYDVEIRIPEDAPGGTWRVIRVTVSSYDGFYSKTYPVDPHLTFQVIQTSKFSLPTEARVTINPSQEALLRQAAINVQAKFEALKASLAVLSTARRGEVEVILAQNVRAADEDLTATEQRFFDLLTEPKDKDAANVFFSDLHLNYELASNVLKASMSTPGVVLASFQHGVKSKYPVVAQAVFTAFQQNELAYNLVADTKSLLFDLDVRTVPTGATVSYGRRGDAQFRDLQDLTNSVIKALPYAIWIVRFEKPGYAAAEREHDPFSFPNHVLTVELSAEKK